MGADKFAVDIDFGTGGHSFKAQIEHFVFPGGGNGEVLAIVGCSGVEIVDASEHVGGVPGVWNTNADVYKRQGEYASISLARAFASPVLTCFMVSSISMLMGDAFLLFLLG